MRVCWLCGEKMRAAAGRLVWGVQLQGATLDGAQLESAELRHAQLQGASLENAHLQGAALTAVFVWRAKPPIAHYDYVKGALFEPDVKVALFEPDVKGAFIEEPESAPKYQKLDCPALKSPCDWSAESYAALKSQIETPEKPPYTPDEALAAAWAALAGKSARAPKNYFETLAKTFEEIGCAAADGAPYVARGLTLQLIDARFSPAQETEMARVFLDDAKCPGARRLGERFKAQLEQIRDRPPSLPPPPPPSPRGPGAPAR